MSCPICEKEGYLCKQCALILEVKLEAAKELYIQTMCELYDTIGSKKGRKEAEKDFEDIVNEAVDCIMEKHGLKKE